MKKVHLNSAFLSSRRKLMHFQAVWVPFYPDGFFAFIWQITETGGLLFISAASRRALVRLRSRLRCASYESIKSGSFRADHCTWQPAFLSQLTT